MSYLNGNKLKEKDSEVFNYLSEMDKFNKLTEAINAQNSSIDKLIIKVDSMMEVFKSAIPVKLVFLILSIIFAGQISVKLIEVLLNKI